MINTASELYVYIYGNVTLTVIYHKTLNNVFSFYICVFIYNLSPPLFIEVPVSSQESERSCIYVSEVPIFPLSTILISDLGIIQTVWYFLFFILIYKFIYSIILLG